MSNAIQFDFLNGKLLCNDQPMIDAYTTQNEFEAYRWSTNKHPKDIGVVYQVKPFEILPGCWCSIIDFTGQSIVFGCTAHQPYIKPPALRYSWGWVIWFPDDAKRFAIGITCKTKSQPTAQSTGRTYYPAIFTQTHCVLPDCTGVYVIHNISKNMYYVGQAQSVNKRLKQHFSGRGGNGDIYADYKYGDKFEIQIHKLRDSPFDTLDAMERYYIRLYHADVRGYNKTSGNKS